jgi:ATP-dependent DNA helicase RecQ
MYKSVEFVDSQSFISFGMGIHKPDIRLVINYGMPSSLEAYTQQTGRAGRDGEAAECVLLHHRGDISKSFGVAMQGQQTSSSSKRLQTQLRDMSAYAMLSSGCRRTHLLLHFEEVLEPPRPRRDNCCDLCDLAHVRRDIEPALAVEEGGWIRAGDRDRLDLSDDMRLLLHGVIETGEWSGIGLPIDTLCGCSGSSSSKRLRDVMSKSSFSKGKHRSKEWWRALANLLVEKEGYMDTALAFGGKTSAQTGGKGGFAYQKYFVTLKGRLFLDSKERVEILPSPELARLSVVDLRKKYRPVTVCSRVNGEVTPKPTELLLDDDLEVQLRELRQEIASASGMNPYNLLANADLLKMVRRKPIELRDLEGLSGWGQWKVKKLGLQFTNKIREFLKSRGYQRPITPLDDKFVPILAPPISNAVYIASSPLAPQLKLYNPNYLRESVTMGEKENFTRLDEQVEILEDDAISYIPSFSLVYLRIKLFQLFL